MALRDLLVTFRIDVDDSKLKKADKQIDKTKKSAGGLLKALGGLKGALGALGGALAIAKLSAFTSATLAEVDAIGKLAAQVGLATDELQAMALFTSEAGASNEDLRITLKSLSKNADLAAGGSKEMAKRFKDLGVEVKGADGQLRPVVDLLFEVGGKLGDLEDPTKRVAKAQGILGEASLKLLPGFKAGSVAAQAQLKTLREIAVVYDKDLIAATEAFNDRLGRSALAFKRVTAVILKFALPIFNAFLDTVDSVSNSVADFASAFKGVNFSSIVANFTRMATAAGLVAVKLIPVRRIIQFVAKSIAGLIARVGGLAGGVSKLGRLLAVGARLVLRFLLPFLILDDIIVFLQGGDSALGRLIDSFAGLGASKEIAQSLINTIKLIGTALFGVTADSNEATLELDRQWGLLAEDLKFIWGDLMSLFGEALDIAINGMNDSIDAFGSDIEFIWTRMKDSFFEALDAMSGGLSSFASNAFDKLKGVLSTLGLIDESSGGGGSNAQNAQSALAAARTPTAPTAGVTNSKAITLNDYRTIDISATTPPGQSAGGSELRSAAQSVVGALRSDSTATLAALRGGA